MILTEDDGFYFLENGELNRWNVIGNTIIRQELVFRSTKLKDGSFVLGTRSNGVYQLSAEGKINYHINTATGLSNNTIHAVFEDVENNIWLALDNGINCINIKSMLLKIN